MHDERHRFGVGLVADRVWNAPGERDDVPGGGGDPPDRALAADVEGELPAQYRIDLARVVAMHDRGAAARRHADLDREQRTAGLRVRRQDGDLVEAGAEALGRASIDR